MEIPKWFLARLKDADPALIVYFNPFQRRYVIDRVVPGQVNTNVMVVQAENGEYMDLSDNVIDRVLSMDAWREFGSYEAFHRHNIQKEVESQSKLEKQVKDSYHEAAVDDKIQLHRAYDLTQRHDTLRVNQ